MTNTKLSEGVSERKINSKWIALTISVLILLAGLNIFIQDDAIITFRYAENLVEHHDLTWNPGERPRVAKTFFTLRNDVPILEMDWSLLHSILTRSKYLSRILFIFWSRLLSFTWVSHRGMPVRFIEYVRLTFLLPTCSE